MISIQDPIQPTQDEEQALKLKVKVDEKELSSHLRGIVLQTVQETLNQLLDKEADELCNAKRYERSEHRKGGRAGHYERKLETTSGKVTLKIPKLRNMTFETQIIERYRRKESSVEEALMEMYMAGVSVRRVEDITEALWGTRVSASTISDLNQKLYARIEEWRNQPILGEYPYVYLDGIWLKRSWAGEVKNVAVLVAIGVNLEGHREILGVIEGIKEDKASWLNFLRHLKERGLKGVKLITSDKCLGLVESLGEVYPDAKWQRCVVHFYRNVLAKVPRSKMPEVAAMLKAIHAQEDLEAAKRKSADVLGKLRTLKLESAEMLVAGYIEETLSYFTFPREHWKKIRTNNPLERINREIRRRTRVVGNFPDGNSAVMLVAGRLRYITTTNWSLKRYLDMTLLTNLEQVA